MFLSFAAPARASTTLSREPNLNGRRTNHLQARAVQHLLQGRGQRKHDARGRPEAGQATESILKTLWLWNDLDL